MKRYFVLFAMVLMFVSTSCEKKITDVTLDIVCLTIAPNYVKTLVATVLPENASNKNVTWTSSNEVVATVNNGVVSTHSVGQTIITVTTEDGNKTATCKLTVSNTPGQD